MYFKKGLSLICLILLFAVTGCVRKPAEEAVPKPPVTGEEEFIKIYPGPGEKKTGGPLERLMPKMFEPEQKIALEGEELLIADFEGWPNNLGGEMGVYGSLEPDWEKAKLNPVSWVYEPITIGYNPADVHSGKNSFRLVNALGTKPDLPWGSFAMDLGPTIDLTIVPKRVISLDVSGYKYLVFWAKGEKGTEKMEFLVRDSHALNYNPQVKYKLPDLTTEWQKIAVPLGELSGKVDLTQLDNIGIAFGKDVGNMAGDIAYIDDFVLTNTP